MTMTRFIRWAQTERTEAARIAALILLLLAGCSEGTQPRSSADVKPPPVSEETSIGSSVAQDDPALPRADFGGNTPADVVLAYVRATNRGDWKTRWALIAPPKGDYDSVSAAWEQDPVPFDDFEVHETRVVERGRALVRVTYSTVGFSAQEGQTAEESRRLVVIREPGEWWVVEKEDSDDATWRVTLKGPAD